MTLYLAIHNNNIYTLVLTSYFLIIDSILSQSRTRLKHCEGKTGDSQFDDSGLKTRVGDGDRIRGFPVVCLQLAKRIIITLNYYYSHALTTLIYY